MSSYSRLHYLGECRKQFSDGCHMHLHHFDEDWVNEGNQHLEANPELLTTAC